MKGIITTAATVAIRASEAGECPAVGPRPVEIVAFTGEPLIVPGYDKPVVLDLATLTAASQRIPILHNHQQTVDETVGRTDAVEVRADSIVIRGVLTAHNERSREVIAHAHAGLDWQSSIGAVPGRLVEVPTGQMVQANGREYVGPCFVAYDAVLREVSLVILGADRHTIAIVASAQPSIKGANMPTFEEWLASKGFTADQLDETQRANMLLMYQEQYPSETTDAPPGTPAPTDTPPEVPASVPPAPTPPVARSSASASVVALRDQTSREIDRINAVRTICASHGGPLIVAGGRSVPLESHAVRSGWTVERTELEAIRAVRPVVNAGAGMFAPASVPVIEAALAQAGRLPNVERVFPAPVLEAAHRQYRGRLSVHEMIHAAALAGGYVGSSNVKANLAPMLRAAFSTYSLSGILSNNANKFLVAGFMTTDGVWSMISRKRPVSDFKTVTSYRMTGSFQFEKIAADGELKHETVSEQSYTNKADTYGKMFAVTRQDLINDDLGAFSDVPTKIGRGAGLKLNDVFWTAFLDNSTFFTSGRANYFTGASTNLQASSLATAEQKFLDQTDDDGKPVAVNPAILLVPTPLKRTAMELMSSSNFVAGGGASGSQIPSANTWQGAYQVAVPPYLSNSSYTGYSATGWYLLADPSDLAVIEVCFLNGIEQPTVETADADFSTLGIQMRGFFDFGVSKQEYRAGVKSKGAA